MINLSDIVKASVSRANRWHPGGLEEWSALEWAGATAGEAGEACNAAKKLKRLQTNLQHVEKRSEVVVEEESYKDQVAKEAADTILYALLLMVRVNRDPELIIASVFNATSESYEFPERLNVQCDCPIHRDDHK